MDGITMPFIKPEPGDIDAEEGVLTCPFCIFNVPIEKAPRLKTHALTDHHKDYHARKKQILAGTVSILSLTPAEMGIFGDICLTTDLSTKNNNSQAEDADNNEATSTKSSSLPSSCVHTDKRDISSSPLNKARHLLPSSPKKKPRKRKGEFDDSDSDDDFPEYTRPRVSYQPPKPRDSPFGPYDRELDICRQSEDLCWITSLDCYDVTASCKWHEKLGHVLTRCLQRTIYVFCDNGRVVDLEQSVADFLQDFDRLKVFVRFLS